MAKGKSIYPNFSIAYNKTPNRFYAIPLIGFLARILILIPVFIEWFFLGIAFLLLWVINSFIILFTGEYWDTAYTYFVGLMNFSVKISAYIFGLTDIYPGFMLSGNKNIKITIDKPNKPNRWFAIPVLGLLVRVLLLIPFYIFIRVMEYGSWIAMFISWVPVLFQGRFPESTYEFESDTLRLYQSAFCFITGLSDAYPSFSISMKHKPIKIALIIAGTVILLFGFINGRSQQRQERMNNYYQNNYNYGY